MYPPVYNSFRRLTEDTDIGGHCIPKGIVLYTYIIHTYLLCTYVCMYTYIQTYCIDIGIYLQVYGSLLTSELFI